MRGEVDAVLLDVGGVLMLPNPEPISRVLRDCGIEPPDDLQRFHRAHYVAGHAYDASGDDPEVWNVYLAAYLRELGLDEDEQSVAYEPVETLFATPAFTWSWRQDDALDAMRELAALGLDLAIVSNSDGTVEQLLRDGGVCQVGDGAGVRVTAIVDSHVVGIKKPDPRIFGHALDRLDVPPHRIVYVGDTARNDVAGARAAGLIPVQVDPYDQYHGDHLRITRLSELVERLR